jgi:hypothetical protein
MGATVWRRKLGIYSAGAVGDCTIEFLIDVPAYLYYFSLTHPRDHLVRPVICKT